MADVAGTPEAKPAESQAAPTSAPVKDDSGLNEQQKKEWMTLKQKAEDFNKLKAELDAKNELLSRLAYSGGQQATDPRVVRSQQVAEFAQGGDPVSAELLEVKQAVYTLAAENWLNKEMLEQEVPKAKQESVKALIRAAWNQGGTMSIEDALNRVTDPETKTLAEQLHALQQENERLKNAKPNGASPASVVPATASADDGNPTNMKMSDYLNVLHRASAEGASEEDKSRARALKQAAGSNKLKLERE